MNFKILKSRVIDHFIKIDLEINEIFINTTCL
jgi:hypothetical protein